MNHLLRQSAIVPSNEIEKWAELLSKQGHMGLSNRDVARAFDLSETAARERLTMLCNKGILKAYGEKRGRKYFLVVIEGNNLH